MGLFLLGLPLAVIGGAVLLDNIKYTRMDLRIENASPNLNEQYQQIRNHYIDILDYSGAECKIEKIGDKYKITKLIKGQYGGMERYLAEKGFYPEAINYAKTLFDKLADTESRGEYKDAERRVREFENALITSQTNDTIVRYQVLTQLPNYKINKRIEQLTEYFNNHHNEVFCNVIMNSHRDFVKHEQVWHMKEPYNKDAEEYYKDVCIKLGIRW